jgi:membrane-bound lytic murein transglycosylase D
MDVRRAAELAEMSVEEFRYLNPQHNRPVIAGADEYAILLPIDKAEVFAAKLELTDQPLVSWQAHRLRTGESLPKLAAKFGMSVEALRAVNGIGARSKVHVGHTLLVPAQLPADDAAQTLTSAVFTTVPQGRTFYYRVQRGDTLTAVAARYAVTPDDLRRWNRLTRNTLKAGQSLRITSDLAPNAAKAKQAAGRKPSSATAKAKGKASRPTAKGNGSPASAKAGVSGPS